MRVAQSAEGHRCRGLDVGWQVRILPLFQVEVGIDGLGGRIKSASGIGFHTTRHVDRENRHLAYVCLAHQPRSLFAQRTMPTEPHNSVDNQCVVFTYRPQNLR